MSPPAFVDIHGIPVDLRELARGQPAASRPGSDRASAPRVPTAEPKVEQADLDVVFDALALAGCARNQTWLLQFMRLARMQGSGGRALLPAELKLALQQLQRQGRIVLREGQRWDIAPADRVEPLARLLRTELGLRAWRAWAQAGAPNPRAEPRRPNLPSSGEQIGFVRLVAYGDIDRDTARSMLHDRWGPQIPGRAIGTALVTPLLPERLRALQPAWRDELLTQLVETCPPESDAWRALFPVLDGWLRDDPRALASNLRLTVADRRIHLGDLEGCEQLLATVPEDPQVPVLRAALLARQGRWQEARAAFTAALKTLGKVRSARRGLVPFRTLQWQLWALLAQPDAAAWAEAARLAIAESGVRAPAPSGWGLFAHAATVRLGDAPLAAEAFEPLPLPHEGSSPDQTANTLLLAAWLGHKPRRWSAELIGALLGDLVDMDRPWKAQLLLQACARLELPVPPQAAALPELHAGSALPFFGAPPEPWRDALAAIRALGGGPSTRAKPAATETLLWRVQADAIGRLQSIQPFTVPMGARGPLKPREMTLTALQRRDALDPRDAAVRRCIQTRFWGRKTPVLDLSAAIVALVGHPFVELVAQPGRTLEIVEALPQLEVRHHVSGDGRPGFEFALVDEELARTVVDEGDSGRPGAVVFDGFDDDFDDDDDDFDPWDDLDPDDDPEMDDPEPEDAARAERWQSTRLLVDGSGRARLFRLTPAQLRVMGLLAQRWVVPADAREELDAALRVLAAHFQLHSDAEAGREVDSDARLRAQLVPQGQALQLRLIVRPFGEHGPEAAPGRGRERVLTVHQGENLQTRRRLDDETAHLGAVREAMPFLDDVDAADGWLLADPEQALTALERLPGLPAVAAVEWPRGKPVRVLPLREGALKFGVSSGRDWFALDGELQLDERRVLSLQQLLQLVAASRQGRFVALGEGEYLALTDSLRRQLADLRALAQADGSALKLPMAAAAWLDETLQGHTVSGDGDWTGRLERLAEAATLAPQPPAGLQAELRAYQAEGFAWMARLAHAGLGGCLADDMGLGKTVQTLALLLHRASLGPALVLAPTSVCANWVAEAQRFAPTLEVSLYGSGDREQTLAGAGPGRVVVVSYALAHLDIERLQPQRWSTLVLDEAQALKNAATQRARSVAELDADFRLALSGTPVENRLADLWSLMNLLVPGLLGSAARFQERLAAPIERDRDEAARLRLRRLVSPFLLRRTKAQVLHDLPPRTEIVHRVEPGPEELALLEALRRDAVARLAEAAASGVPGQAAIHMLTELMRLRRAACDPRLASPELNLAGAKSAEFERLARELVEGRHKALVFSQFTDFLQLLAERLREAGIAHQYLDGSTPAAARAERVAAFQRGEGDLFLISLKAGGFGLNLTAADYVIIVDPWWNPAAEDQAMGRAHRIGQQRPVTVYRLVTAGSIEERIVALHQDKRSLADGILAGQDEARAFSAEELRQLLDED